MADTGWYSGYYKDRNKTSSYKDVQSKPKETVVSKDKQVKLTKEFIQEVVKTNPPKPSASRYLDYRKKELIKGGDESFNHPVEKSRAQIQDIITPKKEPKFQPYYSKPYYPSYSREKIQAEEIEPKPEKSKPDPNQVLMEVRGKIGPKINRAWIILGVLIIIVIILGGIYFYAHLNKNSNLASNVIANPNPDPITNEDSNIASNLDSNIASNLSLINEKFIPLEIITSNTNADSIVSYNNKSLFALSAKDSSLEYAGVTNTLTEKPAKISEKIISPSAEKQITLDLVSNNNHIKNSSIIYTLYMDKPYLKMQFYAYADNSTAIGDFKYAIQAENYDVYSDLGDVYNNSYDNASLNNSKNNSSYEDNSDYQILVNKNKTQAIILYSPYSITYQDSFYTNIYSIDVLSLDDNAFAPVYAIVIDNPNLTYDPEAMDWTLDSDQYKGPVTSYIDEVLGDIGDETTL